MATVKQTGGDYSTLNAAFAGAETTISIEGTWTAVDSTKATCSTANTTVTVDASSKHPGYINEGTWTHYRLVCTAGHCLTVTGANLSLTGIVIHQDGGGVSDEGIRVSASDLTVADCIIYGNSSFISDQDAIYIPTNSTTTTVKQCIIYNFRRGAIRYAGAGTSTVNVNSCILFNNSQAFEQEGGGVVMIPDAGSTVTANVHNTISLKNTAGSFDGDYYAGGGGTEVMNISHSIDSDNSIAGVLSSGTGNLASRTQTDSSSPGAGDWVIFNDITTYPYDLRLKDHATENDAKNMHAVATAHGLTIPANDIVNTVRPQDTNYDCGAFEIVGAAPAAEPVMPSRHRHFANLLNH